MFDILLILKHIVCIIVYRNMQYWLMNNTTYQMKPQDVLLLLRIIRLNDDTWTQLPMAEALGLSQSEVSEAVTRCKYAGLLDIKGKKVMRQALFDFIRYGIKYVFPQRPGSIVRGVPTAHSAPPLSEHIISNEAYVWPYAKGTVRGQSIQPLYSSVPSAALRDPALHELLALVDAVRVGRAREQTLALESLKNRIFHGE